MPDNLATDCTTDEELQAWHDEATAEYEEALTLYTRKQNEKTKATYEEARDQLDAGRTYWRQVGEQMGTRTGVLVEGEE